MLLPLGRLRVIGEQEVVGHGAYPLALVGLDGILVNYATYVNQPVFHRALGVVKMNLIIFQVNFFLY